VWPYDDISLQEVEDDLKAIEAIGSLLIYKVDGKKYLQLINWWKYQQGQWASPSDYPAPDGWTDRARYHGKGGEIITLHWDISGGFNSTQTTKQDSTLDSALYSTPDSRERREEEGDVEDDGEEERINSAAEPPKQPRTAEEYKISVAKAMQRGFENHMTLQARVESAFSITPNWHTKTNRAIMLWLKQRPEEETVEIFAEWWYSKDWRGKEKQPPNLSQMRELWPQAFKDIGETGRAARRKYREGKFADIIHCGQDE
jgi:hypothetical protein